MSATPFPAAYPDHAWTATHASLGESIRALATSLMNPAHDAPERSWQAHLRRLLDPVRAAFAEHRAVTEGAQGLYAEVVHDAPRLAHAVNSLLAEHHLLDVEMASLARWVEEVGADAETVRRRTLEVLGELRRHRQHDADLVHEAYSTDIGGE